MTTLTEKAPADLDFMRRYDELASWANQIYSDAAAGEITADSLTPYIRNRMKEVWQNQVLMIPATATEAYEALGPGPVSPDVLLVELPETENSPGGYYRIYRAPAYTEGKDWCWATFPDGTLSLAFTDDPLPTGTVKHSWDGLTRTDTEV